MKMQKKTCSRIYKISCKNNLKKLLDDKNGKNIIMKDDFQFNYKMMKY